MFTIRHIELDNHQCLQQVKTVYLIPGEHGGQERVVLYHGDGSEPDEISNGTVYVMNDNGKTVAVYNFVDVRQKGESSTSEDFPPPTEHPIPATKSGQ